MDDYVRVTQVQAVDDVRTHPRRCRRGHGDIDRPRAQPAQIGAEVQIRRTEAVAPLRDAVRLVNDEQRDGPQGELLDKLLIFEALRRDVEEALLKIKELLIGGAAADRSNLETALHDGLDLVFHQRQQRRNHDSEAWHQLRGELERQRLAVTRRQHREHVSS